MYGRGGVRFGLHNRVNIVLPSHSSRGVRHRVPASLRVTIAPLVSLWYTLFTIFPNVFELSSIRSNVRRGGAILLIALIEGIERHVYKLILS